MNKFTGLTTLFALCFLQSTELLVGSSSLYQSHQNLATACAYACNTAALQANLCKDSHGVRYADMYRECAQACERSAKACKMYAQACRNHHHQMNNNHRHTGLERASMHCMQACRATKNHCTRTRKICMNQDCSAGVKVFSHCIKRCRLMIKKHHQMKFHKFYKKGV